MTDDLPAPAQGLVLTHFLTVRDVARSRDFYAGVLEIGQATGMPRVSTPNGLCMP